MILELPLLHPTRAAQASLFAASLLGALSRNERVHGAVAAVFLLIQLGSVLSFGYEPGSVSPP